MSKVHLKLRKRNRCNNYAAPAYFHAQKLPHGEWTSSHTRLKPRSRSTCSAPVSAALMRPCDMVSGPSFPPRLWKAIPLLQLFQKSREYIEHIPVLPSRNFLQESNEVGRVCMWGGGVGRVCCVLIYAVPYAHLFPLKMLRDPPCHSTIHL